MLFHAIRLVEDVVREVRDRFPETTAPAIPLIDATGLVVRLVPSGPQPYASSTSIVFASDHPPVDANLLIGGSVASAENPVPIVGVTPRRSPNGSMDTGTAGVLSATPGALVHVEAWYTDAPASYLMLFDGAPASNTMLFGHGFEMSNLARHLMLEFLYPVNCTTSIQWAMSSTPTAYTADVNHAIVWGQWR